MTSTLRTVGTGVASNTVASIAVKLFALVNIFLVLRILSVYNYGVVQLVISVYSVVESFLLPGLAGALVADLGRHRGAGERDAKHALTRGYLTLQFSLGIIAFIVMFFGAGYIERYFGHLDISYFLSIVAFGFLFNPLRAMLTILTTVELRFVLQSILSVLDEGFKLCLLLFFIFGFHMGVAGVLYATMLTPLAVFLATLPWSIGLIIPLLSAPETPVSLRELFAPHRRWGIMSSYFGTFTQNARIWIIKFFLGTEAVGLFSFAQGIASQASGLLTYSSIATGILSQAAHERDRLAGLASRLLKYQLWLTLAALIPGMAITPFFIHYFFPAYSSATVIAVLFLLTLLPSSIGVVVNVLYPALQLQRVFFFRATILKFVLMILLMPVCILVFGFTGLVIEPILTNLFSVIERTRAARKFLPGFTPHPQDLLRFDATDRDLLNRLLHQLPFVRGSID